MKRNKRREAYQPQLDKNLRTRLLSRFRDQYRFLGDDEILLYIVDDILSVIENEFSPMSLMKKGQILWDGIAQLNVLES